MSDGFEETSELPAGRKPRIPSDSLLARLAESAKRGVAFTRTAPKDAIEELRKDLGSAAVKAKYDITTATSVLENGHHKLTFAAKAKAVPATADDGKAKK